MQHHPISLIEFLLEEERKQPQASGSLTLLLSQLEYASRIISSHVQKAGLVDILGSAGTTNASNDEVKKLDVFSNDLLIKILSESGQVTTIGSEELDIPITSPHKGPYDIFFDPLDGSSNIDVNVSIGTIFSIYHHADNPLQQGRKQVAAGYIIYGSSTMFVYSAGNGVNGFTLDPSIGSYLLSHPNIRIPQTGNIYSINEAYSNNWDQKLQAYINALKEQKYVSRYVGTMVADVHRTLLKGGIFINPRNKLRLGFEVNPFAYVVEQAGGKVTSQGQNPLDMTPGSMHQELPVALGSPDAVEQYIHAVYR